MHHCSVTPTGLCSTKSCLEVFGVSSVALQYMSNGSHLSNAELRTQLQCGQLCYSAEHKKRFSVLFQLILHRQHFCHSRKTGSDHHSIHPEQSCLYHSCALQRSETLRSADFFIILFISTPFCSCTLGLFFLILYAIYFTFNGLRIQRSQNITKTSFYLSEFPKMNL